MTLNTEKPVAEEIEHEEAYLAFIKQVALCSNPELPKDYIELTSSIWKAFILRKRYRDMEVR